MVDGVSSSNWTIEPVTVLEAENRPGGRLFTKKVEVKDKNGDAGENREQYHVIQKSWLCVSCDTEKLTVA